MRVALATCSGLPSWEVDDRPLHAALAARGATVELEPWDDPGFAWRSCDACLIRTTWDYELRRDRFVAWAFRVAAETRLFNPPEIVRWNTDKRYLRELEARGVPVIPTVWLPAGGRCDLAALLAERGWSRGFLKPVVGSTARASLRFDVDDPGLAAAGRHLERTLAEEPMMLQPYLESVESEGELSVIFIDGEPSHAVRKVPVPGDWRVQDDFGASDEPIALDGRLLAVARQALAAVEPDLLYARVDLLQDAAGELRVTELELVEPSLFFRHRPEAADLLAAALLRRIAAQPP